MDFHHPTFYWKVVSKEHFYCVSYLRLAILPSPAPTAPHAAPRRLTHNTNTYKYRHIQNSLTLSVPLPLPSLLYTQTHMHKRFCAFCMRQYEGITQARKGKAELDYSGSLWHEKPTDKFLSPTTAVRIGLSNKPSYTHAYAHSQAWNSTWFAWQTSTVNVCHVFQWNKCKHFSSIHWHKCIHQLTSSETRQKKTNFICTGGIRGTRND